MTQPQINQTDALKNTFIQMKPQFQMTLPKHVDPDKFVRILMTAVATTPSLVSADRSSLFAACMKAAQDGLLPDSREASLVIFKSKDGAPKVQYMPMVQGILKKIRNSGELATITSQIVFENDNFEYWVDSDGEHLNHRPDMFNDRGNPVGVYGLAKTKDGAIYLEVMTRDQVIAVKNVSKSKDSGPWAGDFADEMWKKTVLRRLSKKLPMSTDLEDFVKQDDDLYDFTKQPEQITSQPKQPLIDNQSQPVDKTKPNKLSKMIKEKPAEIPAEASPEIETPEVPI